MEGPAANQYTPEILIYRIGSSGKQFGNMQLIFNICEEIDICILEHS
jgi:hypothetical protein